MLTALSIATLAVLLGALLGLFGGRDSLFLQPVYAFGVVAALVVVAGHLLPEAASGIGVMALVIFAIGLAVPSVVERFAARPQTEAEAPLTVGFAALLLHQAGDGAALGAAAHTDAALEVGIAIAAHTVPLVTLMMALMVKELGMVRAWRRALAMMAATAFGVLLVQVIPEAIFETIEPYTSALIAGVLLHVVLHAPPSSVVRPIAGRLLELVAIAGGAAIALADSGGHDAPLAHAITESFVSLSLTAAPALLGGLLLAAFVQTLGARLPTTWMHSGPQLLQALRGAVVGVPLPVCTCGVLPTGRALLERGAAPALIVAFVVAAPVLGLDTFLLTGRLTGLPFALLRVAAVIFIAVVGALALTVASRRRVATSSTMAIRARVQGPQRLATRPSVVTGRGQAAPKAAQRALHHFDELVFHVVPWAAAGLLLASYLDVLLPMHAIAGGVVDVLVVTAIAVPSYVSASAVTPVAAVLLAKGLSPGAALAGLVIGPATDVATIGFLKRSFGSRATWVAIAALIAATLACAFALNAVAFDVAIAVPRDDGLVARGSALTLVVLAIRSIWQSGVVAWAEALSRTPSLEWRVSRAYARL